MARYKNSTHSPQLLPMSFRLQHPPKLASISARHVPLHLEYPAGDPLLLYATRVAKA